MKKKLLSLLIAGMMGTLLLAGCGMDKEEAAAPAPAETTETEEAAPAEEESAPAEEPAAESDAPSEFTFSDLQDNYALLVDSYNEVEKLYMDDVIAQDDEVESLLTEAKGLIDQMGELTEADFNGEDDLLEMNDAIVNILDGLSGIIDKMSAADTTSADSSTDDISYVDGFYANDGNGSDFIIAFYEGAAGDVAYVNDGTDEVYAEYTVEKAQLDDGTEYLLVSVGNTQLGYYEEGSDVFLIDSDSNVYAAARLTEEEADEIYRTIKQ
ncbi:MAG: hypothetical protein IJT16_06435 [Lachnospiraceae bacterium]|nr:hypothetical protein [Lachnospiraceae bacterium]